MNYDLIIAYRIFVQTGVWYDARHVDKPWDVMAGLVPVITRWAVPDWPAAAVTIPAVTHVVPAVILLDEAGNPVLDGDGAMVVVEPEHTVIDVPEHVEMVPPLDPSTLTEQDQADALAAWDSRNQSLKSDTLKIAENRFLSLCDLLTGSDSHAKLGFTEITAILEAMPDQAQALVLFARLSGINSECQRESPLGNHWWDNCAWHPEVA